MKRVPVSVRVAGALYGALLRLLPSGLRQRHGRSMRRLHRDLALEAHERSGVRGVLRVALASSGDLVLHLLRRDSPPFRGRGERRSPGPHHRVPDTLSPGSSFMTHLLGDIRLAARSLRKRTGMAAVAAITLALGIGAATSVFSVVWGAWLKPLPYPDPHRLVRVCDRHESHGPGVCGTVSVGNYVDMKEGNRTFESMTIFTFTGVPLGEDERRLTVLYTEPNVFETLGVSPELGRTFGDGTAEGEATVILSHGFWTREFGASPEVLGRDLVLSERPWTIIGVAPEDFDLPVEVDAILPFRWSEGQRNAHGGRSMQAVGRLRPGISLEAARADLGAIYSGIAAEYPEAHEGWTAWITPFREYVVGNDHTVLRIMAAASLLLLLITSANVASLLLARAESRKREVAVRAALGAGRARILTAFLGESLLIGVLGGVLGVAVAYQGIDGLVTIFGDGLRRPSEIGLNPATLLVAVGLTLATSVSVALAPGLRLDLARLTETLRQTGPAGGRGAVALRKGLILAEIVLAVVLVSGAGLLVNTMWRLTRADLGFEPDGAVAAYLELPGSRYEAPADMARLYRRLIETLDEQPQVAASGAGDRVPPDGNITGNGVMATGRPETSTDFVGLRLVTPGYFRAAGIELRSGRVFDWLPPSDGDEGDGDVPVVINGTLADALFPDEDPVGRSVESRDGRQRIVGVARAVRQRGATEPAGPMIYYPWPAVPLFFSSRPVLLVRGEGGGTAGEEAAVGGLQRALERIDPEIRFSTRPLRAGIGRLYAEQEFALSLMGVFAAVALVLGAVGIYGVMSFTVARRTREIGIRIALGSGRAGVLGMVLKQGMALALVGVALGIAAAVALGRFLAHLLYQVSPADLATYVVVTALFLGTAGVACMVPARRAARVEPTDALREE